ncbi:RNA-binding 7 isoform X1 [Pelobates cultripes]|uniref:RNA-binding 7 isoform X1 n=2 Tax=Pelobates cultripes TaxID=61616 RepID=A0AAD1T540_PELCU|nr:RNA-binding 7 isoform X1 [Pelobates cultripes]
MGASEADRTLFVGNLDPRTTEEILFELFLQAGPATNVKIPKDKDGKPKQFAFVNFKHEESVPYGMSLLNGIKLFGRPLKIQFRSGSKHLPQDSNNMSSPQMNDSGASVLGSPATNGSRYDRNGDLMKYSGNMLPVQNFQRSYSSPENLQRQAVLNNIQWQQCTYGSSTPLNQPCFSSSSTPSPSSSSQLYSNCQSTPQRYDSGNGHQRSRGNGSHPYLSESRHYQHHHHRENNYRGNTEEYYHDERNLESRSHGQRSGSRWHPSRH